ncbi:MAG: preprotein translocase subunit YajC [Muribaculum sp.]|nr:preprotein translocase subunit YajC [Muribaculum sp.]
MGILLTAGMSEADAAAAGNAVGIGTMVIVYILLFGGLYFFLMRPQKKEQKKVAAMIAALELGDCVLTTSGFYGIVIDISDDTVIVEFGNNRNCRIPMDKSAISRVEKPENN